MWQTEVTANVLVHLKDFYQVTMKTGVGKIYSLILLLTIHTLQCFVYKVSEFKPRGGSFLLHMAPHLKTISSSLLQLPVRLLADA